MVTDCTVKEFDIANGENKTVADKIKELVNAGYGITLLYSAAGQKSMVVVGTKDEDESNDTPSDNNTEPEENAGGEG